MTVNYRTTIAADEGLRLKPYKCTAGKWTIGYGRNLESQGISQAEANFMLDNDIRRCERSADQIIKNFYRLSDNRKIVIVSMILQMGAEGFKLFKKMLACIEFGDFNGAADEMMKSLWATQTPKRCARLANKMRDTKGEL